jgi:fatty acid desaturase
MPTLGVLPDRAGTDARAVRPILARSDRKGLLRLTIHLALIAASSGAIHTFRHSPLLIPAMILQGIFIAYLFAPLHEGVHITAFRTRWLNEAVSWLSGLAIMWNATHFRYSHLAHHRFIQDPTRDPELFSPKPTNVREYLWRLSGLEYLRMNWRALFQAACGRFETMPFVPENARRRLRGSVLLHLGIYLALGILAIRYPAPVLLYWFVPVFLGYPFLLFVLMAEHAGCADSGDNYANTRTTYTWWPLRLIFWNMTYHAEHHINPAIPFHALPAAHAIMRDGIANISPGFVRWNGAYVRRLLGARDVPLAAVRNT